MSAVNLTETSASKIRRFLRVSRNQGFLGFPPDENNNTNKKMSKWFEYGTIGALVALVIVMLQFLVPVAIGFGIGALIGWIAEKSNRKSKRKK